jgi:hypothetical protein
MSTSDSSDPVIKPEAREHSSGLVCQDCGAKDYPTSFMQSSPIKQRMDRDGICFDCGYWRIAIEGKQDTVIDGRIYSVGDVKKPPNQPRAGMAGRRFDIEYFDGRCVTTHDLWSGSEVPERYRHLIPDTARFGGGAECVKVGETTCWNPSRQRPDGQEGEQQ